MSLQRLSLHKALSTESLLIILLGFVILWRGGKSMDVLWITSFSLPLLIYCILKADRLLIPAQTSRLLECSLGVFIVSTILSWLYSESRNYGFDEVLSTLIAVIAFSIGRRLSDESQFRLSRALLIFLLLACGIGVYVYVTEPVTRFVGTFFDARFHTDYWPNAWADFVLLTWPLLLITLPLRSTSFSRRLQAHVVLGFVIASGLLSYSRAGILAAAVQIVCIISIFVMQSPTSKRWMHALSSTVTLVAISSSILFITNAVRSESFPLESVQKKATFQSSEGRSSVSERASFFQQSIELMPSYILLGSGPGSFRFLQPAKQTSILATADHPHNIFLKLGLERGFLALLSFIIICAQSVYPFIGTVRRREWSFQARLAALMAVGCIGIAVHSLVDYNLQFLGILIPASLFVGILSQGSSSRYPLRPTSSFVLQSSALLLFILVLLETPSQMFASYGRHLREAGQMRQAENAFGRAKYASLFPRDLLLESAHLRVLQHDESGALLDLAAYSRVNSHDYRPWRLRGDVLDRAGYREGARDAYLEAGVLGAKYNDPAVFLGTLKTLKDQETFSSHRYEYDQLLNEYALAILTNAHFFALSDGANTVLSIIDEMVTLVPKDDPPLYEALREKLREHITLERSIYRAHLSPESMGKK